MFPDLWMSLPLLNCSWKELKHLFLKCMHAHVDMLVSCADQRSPLFSAEPGKAQMYSNLLLF